LIEFTFLAASERAEKQITITCGFAANWWTYQVSYPQSLWATFSNPESRCLGALRYLIHSKSPLDGAWSEAKRTVTMLQSHNDSLSNLE